MAIIVRDDFIGVPNNTLLANHSPNIGQSWSQTGTSKIGSVYPGTLSLMDSDLISCLPAFPSQSQEFQFTPRGANLGSSPDTEFSIYLRSSSLNSSYVACKITGDHVIGSSVTVIFFDSALGLSGSTTIPHLLMVGVTYGFKIINNVGIFYDVTSNLVLATSNYSFPNTITGSYFHMKQNFGSADLGIVSVLALGIFPIPVVDTFNDANGTLLQSHVADTGHYWIFNFVNTGSAIINSNTLGCIGDIGFYIQCLPLTNIDQYCKLKFSAASISSEIDLGLKYNSLTGTYSWIYIFLEGMAITRIDFAAIPESFIPAIPVAITSASEIQVGYNSAGKGYINLNGASLFTTVSSDISISMGDRVFVDIFNGSYSVTYFEYNQFIAPPPGHVGSVPPGGARNSTGKSAERNTRDIGGLVTLLKLHEAVQKMEKTERGN